MIERGARSHNLSIEAALEAGRQKRLFAHRAQSAVEAVISAEVKR